MVVFIGFASMGVDLGRVQLAKTELQRAADAASRAAASALPDVNETLALAQQYANANLADGSSVQIQTNQDVEFGKWDVVNHTFAVLTGSARSDSNAVRISLRR